MAKTRKKRSAWLDEIMQERAPASVRADRQDWSQHMAEREHSKED